MSHFIDIMKQRRSIYAINKEVTISDEVLASFVKDVILHTPTAFNMQSGRAILLLNEQHHQFWNIALEELRKIVPADGFQKTEDRLSSFMAGYGTVLFFDDTSVTEGFAQQYALYKDNFPIWAQQSNGMMQFALWNIFTEAGLGATLQHYNPLVDEQVKSTWNVPSTWKLIGQMPFGNKVEDASDKAFEDIDSRMVIYK